MFRQHPSLGGLRPMDLNSKEKAVKVDLYTHKKEPSFWENQQHKKQFFQTSKIKVGDYVYVYVPKIRPRGFDVQVENRFEAKPKTENRIQFYFNMCKKSDSFFYTQFLLSKTNLPSIFFARNQTQFFARVREEVNTYVYIKSFQRGALYRVASIDASSAQPLFYLENLDGRPVAQKFYIQVNAFLFD